MTAHEEAESANTADIREAAERLLAQENRVRIMAGKMLADDALLVARNYVALTGSAGELVRLRDSQREVAELRSALGAILDRHIAINSARERPEQQVYDLVSELDVIDTGLARLEAASPSSSVSPSLTETGMGSAASGAPDGKADGDGDWTEYHEFRSRTDPPPWGRGMDE